MSRPSRPLIERIADKFLVDDGCWLWIASLNDSGYGQISRPGGGSPLRAHRVLYELLVGPIPEGMTIDHLCRNRACVNPGHMEVVTRGENARRGEGAMRAAEYRQAMTHCKRGHEFTLENTHRRQTRAGGVARICRACRALQERTRRADL